MGCKAACRCIATVGSEAGVTLCLIKNLVSKDVLICVFTPISLLKFPSLLSNPSWMKIFSTLNFCSTLGLLSFRAFFPRVTVKRSAMVLFLKHKFTKQVQSQLFLSTCCISSKWSHFLPVGEAVGSCEDPAGGDQTAPAAENFLFGFRVPKYGSDPRVGFHSGNCSANDLQLLSSGALATCRHLCNWKMKKSLKVSPREARNGIHRR